MCFNQDVLQDESKLDEDFSNSFINELSRVRSACCVLCFVL